MTQPVPVAIPPTANITDKLGPRAGTDRRAYCLYGLVVSSPWVLPGAAPAVGTGTDIEILESTGKFSENCPIDEDVSPSEWPVCSAYKGGSVLLRWPGVSEVVVSTDGRTITAHRFTGISLATFLTYPLTQALSFALIKLGLEPLHATTVRLGDSAVAIMGDCGYGKSTLAAAFVRRGHGVVSDDLLVTDIDGGEVHVRPGAGRLKLFPDVAGAVLGDGFRGAALTPVTSKLLLDVNQTGVGAERIPLKAIYLLDDPGTRGAVAPLAIQPVTERGAFLNLLKNTYNDMLIGEERLVTQFRHAADIAERIPVRSLSYPRSLAMLQKVYEAILTDQNL